MILDLLAEIVFRLYLRAYRNRKLDDGNSGRHIVAYIPADEK